MSALRQYLVFSQDGRKMALQTAHVIRVVRSCLINYLPGAPRGVQGVINVSGKIIPVMNLKLKAGFTVREPSLTDYIILLNHKNFEFSLLVDEIDGIIDGKEINIIESEDSETKASKKVLLNGMELIFLSNSEEIASESELEFINKLTDSGK